MMNLQVEEKEISSSDSRVDPRIAIDQLLDRVWALFAPAWPINQLIATNPLQGFEALPFEEALKQAHILFGRRDFPKELECCNQYFIKWCQVFFDRGQASFQMPYREEGFYKAWLKLAPFDSALHLQPQMKTFLKSLSGDSKKDLAFVLNDLKVTVERRERFLTLLLSTLSGWSSHVKYCSEWDTSKVPYSKENLKYDFVAVRVLSSLLVWPEFTELLQWDKQKEASVSFTKEHYSNIRSYEKKYTCNLLPLLNEQLTKKRKETFQPKSQFVFCIDVRSEPFRRSLERSGPYETFGFAGFFGLPIEVRCAQKKKSEPSCPAIMSPLHTLKENVQLEDKKAQKYQQNYRIYSVFQKVYQSLKYHFNSPFALVETLGPFAGLTMGLKSLFPKLYASVKRKLKQIFHLAPSKTVSVESIPFEDRFIYATKALQTMGLTQNFAPYIFLCGHGSQTVNNAYETALNCGACSGRAGKNNAQALALILNDPLIRSALEKNSIFIPTSTLFIAAEHNTTTDELDLDLSFFKQSHPCHALEEIQKDIHKAREMNNQWRTSQLGLKAQYPSVQSLTTKHSCDWAQIRPEWGLAKNASLIVAPRSLTQNLNLDGRSFLQSYDWQKDAKSDILDSILQGPMKVAYWINCQYLFSSLTNSTFGGGSKVTKNLVGLLGVMQGNASDLMHGLPWQSLCLKDDKPYHEPIRLSVFIYAPKDKILPLIKKNTEFSTLFKHQWLFLYSLDPIKREIYLLSSELSWKKVSE